jgi:type II secretory pathway component GspD/PulD (secretin)
MRTFILPLKSLIAIAAVLIGLTPLSQFARAAGSPDLVGILAMVTEPSAAAELGLTQDQLNRLEDLIKQKAAKDLGLAAQLRSLPSSERRQKEEENIREVEKQGMLLLTEAQQAKVEMWRLQRLGLAALGDPEVAKKAGLADEQVAKIKGILEGRQALVREAGDAAARREIEKRINGVLDDTQRTAWLAMAPAPKKDEAAAQTETSPKVPAVADAAGKGPGAPASDKIVGPQDGLLLNFNATPWKDVLKWIAGQAELNLQSDVFPTGSFSFSDPYRRYTVNESLDIMNGILLGKGYTLLKNQRVLTCVDLGSGESADIIRAYVRDRAELVAEKDLDSRGTYEIVKCLFTLRTATVEEIEKELKSVLGPHGSVLTIPSAGQILVTETGGKLRIIRETINRTEDPKGVRGGRIVRIPLNYVSAEEVFSIARPLLGLKEGMNTSEDLNLATNAFGDTIFATGAGDKLQKLSELATQMDVKPATSAEQSASVEAPSIKSHPLLGSDPTTTMDVLQTQFSGQSNIRLAPDPKSGNIIAQATKADHEKIEQTISVLAGQSSSFTVIPLKNLEVQAALLALEKIFGKPAKDATTTKGPIFFGDPSSRSIMVKGTTQEIDQVREILTTVEGSNPMTKGLSDGMIVIPKKGKAADRLLEQLELLRGATKRKNPIRIVVPESSKKTDEGTKSDVDEKKVSPAPNKAPSAEKLSGTPSSPFTKFAALTKEVGSENGDEPKLPASTTANQDEIVIFRGPNGMIVTSENQDALKEFNELLTIAEEQAGMASSAPEVIYLQYIRAAAAHELIKNVISGSVSTGSSGGGLLGDVAAGMLGGGGLFGGLFGGGGSSSSTSSTVSGPGSTGEVSIIPDARLNALWVQANSMDLQMIEDLVEMIDIPDSLVETHTRGKPQTIYVKNVPVADVETTVKQVFADRIAQPGQATAQRQPSPQELIAMLGGGRGGGGGGRGGAQQSELKEMTMTISTDKKNNALIVVGPPNLFREVEALVKQMDEDAGEDEQSVATVAIDGSMSPALMKSALESVFGASAKTSTTGQNNAQTTGNNRSTTGGNTNPADMFQQFRNRGTGGGFGGFGGGNNPFGGGGFRQGGQGGGNPFGGTGNFRGGNQGGGNQGGGQNRGGGNRNRN